MNGRGAREAPRVSRTATRRVLVLRGQLDALQVRDNSLVRGLREAQGLKASLEPADVRHGRADDEMGPAHADVLGSSRDELGERDTDRHLHSDVA